ncbi:MAG: class I SAM-dependent methyltransferase [Armatimonadota bacterium]
MIHSWVSDIEDKIKPYGNIRWHDLAEEQIRKHLVNLDHPVLLEVGCGTECWISRKIRKDVSIHVIGIDIDPDNERNADIDEFHVASVDEIPVPDNSVDIVIAAWVLEHFSNPNQALSEIRRVLKPGGHFIFWTPNIYNPAMIISALADHQVHRAVVRALFRKADWDNCKTYYRMNSTKALSRLASYIGFRVEVLDLISGVYRYFRQRKSLYIVACYIGKLSNLWPLCYTRQIIVGDFRKD